MKTIKVDLKLVDWLVMPSLKRRIEDGATANHHILKESNATICTNGSARTKPAACPRWPSGDTRKKWNDPGRGQNNTLT